MVTLKDTKEVALGKIGNCSRGTRDRSRGLLWRELGGHACETRVALGEAKGRSRGN